MKILFLCLLNTVRSPMAEAIARAKFPQHQFESAGFIESPQDFLTNEVLKEIELDCSNHVPTALDKLEIKSYDLVICLADEIRDKIEGLSLKNLEFWSVKSPAVIRGSRFQMLLGYREIRDEIAKKVEQRFK